MEKYSACWCCYYVSAYGIGEWKRMGQCSDKDCKPLSKITNAWLIPGDELGFSKTACELCDSRQDGYRYSVYKER